MYSFANPPIKLKLAHQIGAGTTNSKPLGPITNQIEHIYYTLFYRCTPLLHLLTSHRKPMQLCSAKTNFPEPNRQNFGFASSNFTTVQDHILSTIGDALKGPSSHIKSSRNKLGNFPSLKEYLAFRTSLEHLQAQ
jgi:hypothetical protein